MKIPDAAMTYCNYRILIGGISAIVIGIIICIVAIWLTASKNMDTSNYIKTKATVKSSSVYSEYNNKNMVYKVLFNLKYTVDGKIYDAQTTHKQDFYSELQAQSLANTIKEQVIYYDPKNHSTYTGDKSGEDTISFGLSSVASCIIVLAIISILLKDNPIFCGITIAQDAVNMLRRD
jgi:hypothetical protein